MCVLLASACAHNSCAGGRRSQEVVSLVGAEPARCQRSSQGPCPAHIKVGGRQNKMCGRGRPFRANSDDVTTGHTKGQRRRFSPKNGWGEADSAARSSISSILLMMTTYFSVSFEPKVIIDVRTINDRTR